MKIRVNGKLMEELSATEDGHFQTIDIVVKSLPYALLGIVGIGLIEIFKQTKEVAETAYMILQ